MQPFFQKSMLHDRERHVNLRFREMSMDDLPWVMIIESRTYATPWTETMFQSELANPTAFVQVIDVMVESRWQLRGYAVCWIVVDELHILNIAIDSTVRRRGLGRRLLESILERARQSHCQIVTLEVRRGNFVARALYSSFGFVSEGFRRQYYQDNGEDAVIMNLRLEDRRS